MCFCCIGSSAPAKMTITSKKEAQEVLDEVNERCSMTYRAPELFNIDIYSVIDERIDIWVNCILVKSHNINLIIKLYNSKINV